MTSVTAQALVILIAIVLSIAGVALARRLMPYDTLARNQSFTGVTYTIVGAVYGVYLAFTIVVVWQQFQSAEENTTSEAVHLNEAWRDVQVLPAPVRHALDLRLRDYADSVVRKEWPSMAAGNGADPETAQLYEQVWREIYAVRAAATASGDAPFFAEAIQQMNIVGVQRRMRLLASNSALPTIMWVLLIGGGIVTVGFAYLIGAQNAWLQTSAVAALTGLIVFSLLLVAALQHPFMGDISIKPAAFEALLQAFQDRLQDVPR